MKKYYKSIEERDQNPEFVKESLNNEVLQKKDIVEFLEKGGEDISPSRRDFLKFLGFSFATAAVVSSCKNPVNKAIPYLVKPEDVYPGQASHYATSFFDGKDFSSIVVKVMDGRPIKLEGNEKCPVTSGATSARIQASLLNLYDDATRLRNPIKEGKDTSWQTADQEITGLLKSISASGGKTALLTSSIISPSLLQAIGEMLTQYPGMVHVTYDPVSFQGIREAHRLYAGLPVIPSYRFDKAEYIVGFNCDFLGTWISPVEFSRQYADTRRLTDKKKTLSKHIQLETALTITGSAADERIPIKPSEEGLLLSNLYAELSGLAGQGNISRKAATHDLSSIAKDLWNHRTKSVVVSGSNDTFIQVIVSAINDLLGNYGETITMGNPYNTGKSDDKAMIELVNDMEGGRVQGLIMYNVNPAYSYPEALKFQNGLKKLKLSVSTSSSPDETAKLCQWVCPDNHYLESWTDAEPKKNVFALGQPAINKLFDTRNFLESILIWSGKPIDAYQYVLNFWQKNIFPKQSQSLLFKDFWVNALQNGVVDFSDPAAEFSRNPAAVTEALGRFSPLTARGTEIFLYESIAIGNGYYASNPWLQELPDPVSKVTWDNYIAVSPNTAKDLGLVQGDIIAVKEGLELPVLIQPGQATGTLSAAIGYGRTDAGKTGSGVGKNVYPLLTIAEGAFLFNNSVDIKKTALKHSFAQTQIYHTMEGRNIVRETTLDKYLQDPASGNEIHAKNEAAHQTLYPEIEFPIHDWAMAIDLNACTGCSGCVIACQAENNIPVIGKDEVARKRIMHWIRIDRYYSEDSENPEVVFQPLMCQHCDNAPCENVCPVAATTHSMEGLNQMAYNRCIGTKYCINNCPYKVRRFNWYRYADNPAFAYGSETDLGKMVYNPDVTVRERGVVEKCSFCIQRIQAGKLRAKREGRTLTESDVQTACMQSCPSKAIVFGDMNDPNSEVSKLFQNPRNYHLLEELHTLPSVGYLTKVRNKEGKQEETSHSGH
ncbi:MAG: TAT-variant-translocated molybdopterin oxidoreductase [Bacteroidales bacterium]